MRWSSLRWPITGSIAERRRNSRLICSVIFRLAGDIDAAGRSVVAAIAGVGEGAVERVADQRLHRRDDGGERMPVVRVAGQRCDMGDELTAGGNDAELLRKPHQPFARAMEEPGVSRERHRGRKDHIPCRRP